MSGGLSFGCLAFICPKEKCLCLMGLALRGPDCCEPLQRDDRLGGGGEVPSGGDRGREEGIGRREGREEGGEGGGRGERGGGGGKK